MTASLGKAARHLENKEGERMAQEKKNSFLGGMATMAAALAIVKVIGAIYKIPIRNILGDSYADFTNAYNIYSVLLTISIAGLPVALSKMVAANHALGKEGQVRRAFLVSLGVFLTLGVGSCLLMLFGADALAAAMHDPNAAQAIRFLSPAVLFVSCIGSFRGYFQGRSNMTPSAVSQVIEAVGKLAIGLPLAWWAVKAGRGDMAAAMAILGVTLGEALALIYMMVRFARSPRPAARRTEVKTVGETLGELLAIAVPITITAAAVSVINAIDGAVVQGRLQNALHMTLDQSRNLYAAYSGVMNIYNLPASFIMAVTVSVIPAVSSALAMSQKKEASRVVKASYHITALLVFPMGVGITVLAEPIVRLLFGSRDAEISGSLLAVLGLAAIFVCLVQVSNSVLQAYGYQNLPILVMIGCGLVKVAVNYVLVGIPQVNIHGAPMGTLCCFGLAAVVDFIIISRIVPKPPNYFRLFFGPALATAVMGVAAWGSYQLAHLVLGVRLSAILAILCAVGVYGFLVVWLQLLSREELKLMPKGEKIADLLRLP